MTLVELMVVVFVMVIMLAVAMPLMKTALDQGRVREAARQLNTYCILAKAKAVETGRPVAVWIEAEAHPDDSSLKVRYGYRVYLAETPQPYGGDMIDARAAVRPDPTQNRYEIFFSDSASLTTTASRALVEAGERFQIKFDYRGTKYECYRDANNNDFVIQLGSASPPPGFWRPGTDGVWGNAGDDDSNGVSNDLREAGWPGSDDVSVGLPYQIYRQPRKSSSTMMELPRDTVIDLTNSGFGPSGKFKSPNDTPFSDGDIVVVKPVVITFDPSGSVSRILGLELQESGSLVSLPPPTATLHLLLGRIDQLAETAPDSPLPRSSTDNTNVPFNRNVVDPDGFWISIGHQTGKVTTAENAWALRPLPLPSQAPNYNFVESLQAAREYAQSAQSIGGR